jgi:hypothetical protein
VSQQTTKFSVGQSIDWTSMSAGTWKKKRGKIIEILSEEESISARLRFLGRHVGKSRIKATDRVQNRRYLVEVEQPPKRRTSAKEGRSLHKSASAFYAPLVKVIDGTSTGAGKLVEATPTEDQRTRAAQSDVPVGVIQAEDARS